MGDDEKLKKLKADLKQMKKERDEAIRILVGLVCDGGDQYIRRAHDLIGRHPEIDP